MQRATRKDREEFVSLISQHAGEFVQFIGANNRPVPYCSVFQFAERLMRYGATLGRIAENQCNGYDHTGRGDYDEAWAAREENKETRIQEKVTELCARFGCKPVFQGDPRGATLKVQVPDGYTNDWGREGICVPTS